MDPFGKLDALTHGVNFGEPRQIPTSNSDYVYPSPHPIPHTIRGRVWKGQWIVDESYKIMMPFWLVQIQFKHHDEKQFESWVYIGESPHSRRRAIQYKTDIEAANCARELFQRSPSSRPDYVRVIEAKDGYLHIVAGYYDGRLVFSTGERVWGEL